MNLKNLIVFKNDEWALNSAQFINNQILSYPKDIIDIVLTGGKSANKIYPYLSKFINNSNKHFNIFLSDERCVNELDINSNYRMLKLYFSKYAFMKINKLYHEDKGVEYSINNYIKILPNKINISIIGLGDDGHVASFFPFESYLSNIVIKTISPINISERLSLHLNYLQKSDKIIILASGKNKSNVISKLFKEKNNNLPANQLKNAIFLIDEDAFN